MQAGKKNHALRLIGCSVLLHMMSTVTAQNNVIARTVYPNGKKKGSRSTEEKTSSSFRIVLSRKLGQGFAFTSCNRHDTS